MAIKEEIECWLNGKVDAVGFAPADRFGDAPEHHRPEYMLRGAKTVIEYGRLIPRGVTRSPGYDYWIDCFSCVKVCPLNNTKN